MSSSNNYLEKNENRLDFFTCPNRTSNEEQACFLLYGGKFIWRKVFWRGVYLEKSLFGIKVIWRKVHLERSSFERIMEIRFHCIGGKIVLEFIEDSTCLFNYLLYSYLL
jgi:hypothetical protein